MKNLIDTAISVSALTFVVVMLAAGCASAPVQATPTDYPEERAQIERRLKEVFDAAARKDFDRLDSYHFYGPKFTKFSAASPTRQDTTIAQNGEHKGLAAINDLKMTPTDLKIDIFGNVGIATFVLDSSYKTASGSAESKERSTLVFVKDQGSWKITHEHFSPITSTK